MLSYATHVLSLAAAQKFKQPTGPFDPIVQKFRAWPWYCDQNLHINNARYLTLMDYGRVSWLARTGLLKRFVGDNTALVAGIGMTYRREIRWFRAFELETKVVAVEGRWLYIAQTFWQDDELSARGVLRIGVRGPNGLLNLEDQFGATPPPVDEELRLFIEGADAQVRATKSAVAPT